jgi:hypothetical protein
MPLSSDLIACEDVKVAPFLLVPEVRLLTHSLSDAFRQSLAESAFMEGRETLVSRVERATCLGDLIEAGEDSRTISFMVRQFLSEQAPIPGWSHEHGGISFGQPREISLEGRSRRLVIRPHASFAHFGLGSQGHEFVLSPKTTMSFSANIPLSELGGPFLQDHFGRGRRVDIPVLDGRRHAKLLFRQMQRKNLNEVIDTRKGKAKLGDVLLGSGRFAKNQDAIRKLMQSPNADAWLAVCSAHGKRRSYSYPTADISIIASTHLVGLVKKLGVSAPPEVKHAAELCEQGMAEIRSLMEDREGVFDMATDMFSGFFRPVEARTMGMKRFLPMGTDPSKIRKGTQHQKVAVAPEGPVVVLCSDSMPQEARDAFMRTYLNENGALQKRLGGSYQCVTYSPAEVLADPRHIADQVAALRPAGVIVAWRRRVDRSLAPKTPLEFELMERGIAVQNVVDEASRAKNDPKGPAIRQAIAAKFGALDAMRLGCGPFDIAIGLDISRSYGQGVAAFPVAVAADGTVVQAMPETFQGDDGRERRPEDEVSASIRAAVEAARGGGRDVRRVLFLRDGIAFEDYEAVASALGADVSLTVLSIQKSMLKAFGDDLPTGEHYSISCPVDAGRFLLGVNARAAKDGGLRYLHAVRIIRNPEEHSWETFADTITDLCRQNVCSEAEVASLPLPIAYADRFAWTVLREFVQNEDLRRHLKKNRHDELPGDGPTSLDTFIYEHLARYVREHPNGWALAV